jgi:hypothetical protein
VRTTDRRDLSCCGVEEATGFSSTLIALIAIVASERKPSRSTRIVDTMKIQIQVSGE